MDEELNAVIVEESKKGEKEREEEEQAEASARQNVASIRQGFQPPLSVSLFFLEKLCKLLTYNQRSGADASIRSSLLKLWFHALFFVLLFKKAPLIWIEQNGMLPISQTISEFYYNK